MEWYGQNIGSSCWLRRNYLSSFKLVNNILSDGLWIFGTTVYTALVASMFVRIALLTHTWTAYSHFYFWFSLTSYIAFLLIYQVGKLNLHFFSFSCHFPVSFLHYLASSIGSSTFSVPLFLWILTHLSLLSISVLLCRH